MASPPAPAPQCAVPNRRHCAYCDCELPPHTPASISHCQAFACRRAWDRENLLEMRDRAQEAQAQLTYRIEQFRAQQSRTLRTANDRVVAVRVPHSGKPAVTLTAQRRQVLLQHIGELAETLDQAHREEPIRAKLETPPAPHLDKVLSASCATCQGYCCIQGGEYHAFIQRSTLKRVLEENSDLAPGDLVAHYEQYLPPQAVEGSCAFHTDSGCSLPRNLWSDVCKDHYCEGLNRFVKKNRQRIPDYSVIIAIDNAEPMNASRVSADGEWTPLDVNDIQ